MSIRNGLLALLSEGPRHGYELRKDLESRTGSLWDLNVGQIYTTLARLERDGCVIEVGATPTPDDDDAKHPGADQRRYSLTEDGRIELANWFAEPRVRTAPGRDELVIKITLAEESPDVDFDDVVDTQMMASTQELQTYTRLLARTDETDVPRLMALDAVISQIDAELRWLEKCRNRHHDRPSKARKSNNRGGR